MTLNNQQIIIQGGYWGWRSWQIGIFKFLVGKGGFFNKIFGSYSVPVSAHNIWLWTVFVDVKTILSWFCVLHCLTQMRMHRKNHAHTVFFFFNLPLMYCFSWCIFRWSTHLYMSLFLSVCCTAYLRNRTSSGHNFWYTYVNWWYLQAFLDEAPTSICHFFCPSVCPSCSISHELYIIWS